MCIIVTLFISCFVDDLKKQNILQLKIVTCYISKPTMLLYLHYVSIVTKRHVFTYRILVNYNVHRKQFIVNKITKHMFHK